MDVLITPEIILKRIDFSPGLMFEEIVSKILLSNGFTNVVKTPASGDYGIDILAEKDSVTYAIQCKRYSDSVGNKAVQEVYTGKTCYKKMVAVVITNNYFTKSAITTAEETQVILWDREKLKQLISNLSQYQLEELAEFIGINRQQSTFTQETQFAEQFSFFEDSPPPAYSQHTSQTHVHETSTIYTQSSNVGNENFSSTTKKYKNKSNDWVKESYEKKQMLKETYEKKQPEKPEEKISIFYVTNAIFFSFVIILTFFKFCLSLKSGFIMLIYAIFCSPFLSIKLVENGIFSKPWLFILHTSFFFIMLAWAGHY